MLSTADLTLLRWRVSQWMLACWDADAAQSRALLAAMRAEGIRAGDFGDEFALLIHQFGHRPRYRLADEAAALSARLSTQRQPRCRPRRWRP